ncbi:uncharacterized protein DUF998 [Asanoa ferruginea]|uniref:Uncharacterized protein DUF998 n=1 Tax=Asanoa ferruginea TaxID=53367 RepID=A0A3D9ZP80_9ACTN|nr:DUF998 domain-containing protein [Asanoa ferruginea]REF99071.1 uncharacterized protein DUF998 [Asanoa ferruginea]GIF51365.1 hypothetical protein Afe04nite_59040 [Asanoa ferruginea]
MTAAVSLPATRPATTRSLLAAGAVGGPLFVAGVLAQAYTRGGFDPGRHPLSSLALGELGWVQITNFIGYGVLTLAGAVGLRRALTPGRASTWGPRLIGVGGVALILAGIFPADPINGYPAGVPDAVTWHGTVHSLAPAVAGIAGLIAYVAFARRFAADHDHVWLMWTVAAPVVIVATNAVSAATGDLRALLIGQAVGAAWATSFYLRLRARAS